MEKTGITSGKVGVFPRAFRAAPFSGLGTAGHLDPFAVDKSIGNFAPGLMEIAPCGLPGNPQFYGSFLLFKSFEIDQADQLDLLGLE